MGVERATVALLFVCLSSIGALPLKTSITVAVIGPNFNATSTMQGNYNVRMELEKMHSCNQVQSLYQAPLGQFETVPSVMIKEMS